MRVYFSCTTEVIGVSMTPRTYLVDVDLLGARAAREDLRQHGDASLGRAVLHPIGGHHVTVE